MPEQDPISESNPQPVLRVAVLGMIPGNGHPYSWSAIVNGYDTAVMSACPYPVIPRYLGAQPAGTVGIQGARVTHIWTEDPSEAAHVASAALIPHVASRPEDVIGSVDAVLVATDDGFDHARRAKPFVEAGLPVFVDKPLATSIEELRQFMAWERAGARVMSSSGLRYAREVDECIGRLAEVGELRWLSGVSCKTWERYGIHLLEPLFRIVGPGFESIRLESRPALEVAHMTHRRGVQLTLPVIFDGGGSFGVIQVCGTAGQIWFRPSDTYSNFRSQLVGFIDYVRTGRRPFPFAESVELMTVLIAGLLSRTENSRRVEVAEITSRLSL